METIFYYKVTPVNDTTVISIANAGLEITDEQYQRIMKSKMTGRYEYMDQDSEISDIFQMAYEAAIEVEKDTEYGHLVGTKIVPVDFEYPVEYRPDSEEENLLLNKGN